MNQPKVWKHQCGDLENRWCTNEAAKPFNNAMGSGALRCTHPTYQLYEKRVPRYAK